MAGKKRAGTPEGQGSKGKGTSSPGHDTRVRELEDRMLRMQADFDNYRKSLDRQRCEHEERASEVIIRDLLCVVDDFMNAICKARSDSEKEGLERLFSKLMSVLGRHGLRPIEAVGKLFDHYYHEAVMSQKSEKEEGAVLEEFQKGFMLNSRVLRHSRVKVAKK